MDADFYTSNFAIRLQAPEREIRPYFEKENGLVDAPIAFLAALYHELHHFYTFVGTTWGFFLLSLWRANSRQVMVLAQAAYAQTGVVHKPLLPWVSDTLGNVGSRTLDTDLGRETMHWAYIQRLIRALNGVTEDITMGDADGCFLGLASAAIDLANVGTGRIASGGLWDQEVAGMVSSNEDDDDPVGDGFWTLYTALKTSSASSNHLMLTAVHNGTELDWETLIEGAARLSDYMYRSVRAGKDLPPEAWYVLDTVYSRAYKVMLERVSDGEEEGSSWFQYLCLFDLAANPSINLTYRLPDPELCRLGLLDFAPSWRFMRACDVAARIDRPSIEDLSASGLDPAYQQFVARICVELGWEPPWLFAIRALAENRAELERLHDRIFIACLELRSRHPALLATFPLHAERSELISAIGAPPIAAADSAFKFSFRKDNTKATLRAEEELFAPLVAALHVADYADQLMYRYGPFDAAMDPEMIEDSGYPVNRIDEAVSTLWATYLVPAARVVFDDEAPSRKHGR